MLDAFLAYSLCLLVVGEVMWVHEFALATKIRFIDGIYIPDAVWHLIDPSFFILCALSVSLTLVTVSFALAE